MVNISWVVHYLWIIPAIFMVISLAMLSSPKREYRLHGYSWLMWTGIILLVWCALVHDDRWWVGVVMIAYSIYAYWRNTYGVTVAEVEAEVYDGKEFS